MKYVLIFFFSFMAFSGIGMRDKLHFGSPPFNYDTASEADRKAWLEDEIAPLANGLNRSLPKGDGAQPHMSVSETKVYPASRYAEVIVKISGPAQLVGNMSVAQKTLLENHCGNYMQSALGINKISVDTKIRYEDGASAATLTLSPSACARVTG